MLNASKATPNSLLASKGSSEANAWVGMERFPLAQGLDHWRRYLQVLGGSHTLLLEFMPDDDLATLDREAAALKELAGDRV